MSTPYGIARTSSLVIIPTDGYKGKEEFARMAADFVSGGVLLPTPKYLHDRRAFGVWSLPDSSNEKRAAIEKRITDYMDFYADAIDKSKWYGFGITAMSCMLMISTGMIGCMMSGVCLGQH